MSQELQRRQDYYRQLNQPVVIKNKKANVFLIIFFILLALIIIIYLILILIRKKTNIVHVATTQINQDTATLLDLNQIPDFCCATVDSNGNELSTFGYYIPSLDVIVQNSPEGTDPNVYCKNFNSCLNYQTTNNVTVDSNYCNANPNLVAITTCCQDIQTCVSLSTTTSTSRVQNAVATKGSNLYYVVTGGDTVKGVSCSFAPSTCT
jgi:hypothetical protein